MIRSRELKLGMITGAVTSLALGACSEPTSYTAPEEVNTPTFSFVGVEDRLDTDDLFARTLTFAASHFSLYAIAD